MLATVSDVQLNQLGLMYGFLAIATTAFAQLWVGSKQKEHSINALQMQYHTAPPQTALGLTVAVFAEGWFTASQPSPLNFEYNNSVVSLIALSCVLAVAVNLCSFAIIGKMGPVTYQVVGHAKTCLTLSSGVFLFGEQMPMQNLLGLVMAVAGVVYYGFVKHEEGVQAKLMAEEKDVEMVQEEQEEFLDNRTDSPATPKR